jgi:hypothetical protein
MKSDSRKRLLIVVIGDCRMQEIGHRIHEYPERSLLAQWPLQPIGKKLHGPKGSGVLARHRRRASTPPSILLDKHAVSPIM